MTARDGGTRAAGHANGRVARGYTPRLKTSFPHSRKGHALSGLALRAGGRRDGVSRLLKGGQVGADREIGRFQQSLGGVWSVAFSSSLRAYCQCGRRGVRGIPLSERKRAAQKVGAVSILWRRRDPEAGRGCFERRGASVAGSTVPYQLWTVLFEWKSLPRAYEPTGLVGVRAIAVGRQVWAVLLCTLSS